MHFFLKTSPEDSDAGGHYNTALGDVRGGDLLELGRGWHFMSVLMWVWWKEPWTRIRRLFLVFSTTHLGKSFYLTFIT